MSDSRNKHRLPLAAGKRRIISRSLGLGKRRYAEHTKRRTRNAPTDSKPGAR